MSGQGQAVLGLLGVTATILGSYLAARIAARTSQHATDTTAALTKEANALTRDAQALSGLGKLVEELQEEMQGLRKRLVECERQVSELRRERARDKMLIRHLVAYVQTLRGVIRTCGATVPEAPAGLDLEGGPLS